MLKNLPINYNAIFLFLLALLFTTVFRVGFLLLYPPLVLVIMYLYKLRMPKSLLLFMAVLLLSWLISFYNGFYLMYNLVSFYYFIPFFLLILSRPADRDVPDNTVELFILFLTFFAILNNLLGMFQYARHPDDDEFSGFYGKFTVTQNGLSLLNGLLFFYYLQRYIRTKKILHLIATGFFLISMVLGFYGAGLIALLVSIGLFYARFTVKSMIRLVLVFIFIAGSAYFLVRTISPRTLEYNVNIAKGFLKTSRAEAPRKVEVFYNYYDQYKQEPLSMIFGSGPGTFNSRSAFMVGSPSYFYVDFIKSEKKPWFFENYAYTLWNPTNITRYTGFIAQPFSSLLALISEYGLLLAILFFIGYRKQFRTTMKLTVNRDAVPGMTLYKRLYKFLMIFLVMLIIIDNYIEYPEVVALFALVIKFTEQKIRMLAQEA